jgi:Cu(I)/Ag(I) efflux system membrane fusion protein
LGLSEEQLRDILSRGEAVRDLPIIAPVSGYVVEKNVTRGAAVHAGDRLFRLASLDVVWVEADVPEADLPLVRAGQSARVVLPSLPGKTITGVVARVLPYLDEATRTGRVRIEVRNDGIELKPAMFANVQLDIDLGERLLVPASAVLYTGPRNLVFVDLGEGRFAPREIVIGQKVGDAYEVVSGLSDGDLVVTSGNFLIAAESRLRAGGEPVEDHAR